MEQKLVVENVVVSQIAASMIPVVDLNRAVQQHETYSRFLNSRQSIRSYHYTENDVAFCLETKEMDTRVFIELVGWNVILLQSAMTDTNQMIPARTECYVIWHNAEEQRLILSATVNGQIYSFSVQEESISPLKVSVAA